eukprot:scaffold7481_cov420-Pinguiococcus_pyrenoidosus.AAC.2
MKSSNQFLQASGTPGVLASLCRKFGPKAVGSRSCLANPGNHSERCKFRRYRRDSGASSSFGPASASKNVLSRTRASPASNGTCKCPKPCARAAVQRVSCARRRLSQAFPKAFSPWKSTTGTLGRRKLSRNLCMLSPSNATRHRGSPGT